MENFVRKIPCEKGCEQWHVDILFIFNDTLNHSTTVNINYQTHFTNRSNFFSFLLFYTRSIWSHLIWLCPEAYGKIPRVEFKSSKKNGGRLLVIDGIRFFRNRQRNGKQYWKCSYYYKQKCPTIAILNEKNEEVKMVHEHSHDVWQNYDQTLG